MPVTLAEKSDSVVNLTGPVAASGPPVVTKVVSVPRLVPSELDATRRKWKVAPGASPETVVSTATGLEPAPALREDVREPYEVVVPYSTYHDVERPFGFTVPPSEADVGVTVVAGPVIAIGALFVVKVLSAPTIVPATFFATSR